MTARPRGTGRRAAPLAAILLAWLTPAIAGAAKPSPELPYARAAVALQQEAFPEAERQARRALELAPAHRGARWVLSQALAAQDRFAEAANLLEALLGESVESSLLVDLGVVRIGLGDFEGALSPLEEAVNQSEDDPRAWYYLGYARLRLRRLATAEQALGRAATGEYEERAKYFSAIARAAAGDTDAARAGMEGLADASDPDVAAAAAGLRGRRFVQRRRRGPRRSWSLEVAAGAFWDSNPALAASESQRDADFAPALSLNAGYEPFRWESSALGGELSALRTFYTEDAASNFDLTVLRGEPYVGLRFAPGGLPLTGRVSYRFELSLLGRDDTSVFSEAHGVHTRWALLAAPGLAITFGYGVQHLSYFRADRDNLSQLISAGVSLRLLEDKLRLRVSPSLRIDLTTGDFGPRYDALVPRVDLAVGYTLLDRIDIELQFDYRHQDHFASEDLFSGSDPGDRRVDQVWQLGVNVAYRLSRNLQLELTYGFSDSDSQVPRFDYQRQMPYLGLRWRL